MQIGQPDPPEWWGEPPLRRPGTGMYPTRSECWSCGQEVHGPDYSGSRVCPRCGVQWNERRPGQPLNTRYDERGLELLLASKWPWRPKAAYADKFDGLFDHTAEKLSSPA